jgi:hypothetical protein
MNPDPARNVIRTAQRGENTLVPLALARTPITGL